MLFILVLVLIHAKQRFKKVSSFPGVNFHIFSSFSFRIQRLRTPRLHRTLQSYESTYDNFSTIQFINFKLYKKEEEETVIVFIFAYLLCVWTDGSMNNGSVTHYWKARTGGSISSRSCSLDSESTW